MKKTLKQPKVLRTAKSAKAVRQISVEDLAEVSGGQEAKCNPIQGCKANG